MNVSPGVRDEIARWKQGNFRDDYDFVCESMRRLDLAMCEDGVFVDKHERKRMRDNHIKCMLRRDYQSAGRPLHGKALDLFLAIVIDAVRKAHMKAFEEKRDEVVEGLVSDEYH